jgi:hypothetical protein
VVCLFEYKTVLIKILLKPINVLGIICTTIHLGEINMEGIQGGFFKGYI